MKVKRELGAMSQRKAVPKRSKEFDSPQSWALPTQKTEPLTQLGDYSILLYGVEKIGKTTLAAQAPDALFLMFEPGGKSLSLYQEPMTSWVKFKAFVKLLRSDKRFHTIVVDTVDYSFKMCERSVCRRLGIDHPSDEDWGKGWTAVRDEFAEQYQMLLSLGRGVILISHSVEREVKTRHGSTYHVVGPTMSGQARSVIQPMVDIWVHYTYDRDRRILIVRGDEHITAGVRTQKNFLSDGRPVRQIEMGSSPEEAWTNFTKCFANKYTPPPSEESRIQVKLKKGVPA